MLTLLQYRCKNSLRGNQLFGLLLFEAALSVIHLIFQYLSTLKKSKSPDFHNLLSHLALDIASENISMYDEFSGVCESIISSDNFLVSGVEYITNCGDLGISNEVNEQKRCVCGALSQSLARIYTISVHIILDIDSLRTDKMHLIESSLQQVITCMYMYCCLYSGWHVNY